MKTLIAAVLMFVSFAAHADAQDGDWNYSQSVDMMRNTANYLATNVSHDMVRFNTPYDGGSFLSISVRRGEKYGGEGVLLHISKGQFSCSMKCTLNAKFDNGPIENFYATGAQSPDIIFISDYSAFIAKMRDARRLIIEVDFYREGSKQFTFDLIGFRWNH